MRQDLEARAYRAAFGVVASVHEARYARLNHGARAHAARLDGDVKSGAGQPVVAERGTGAAQSELPTDETPSENT